MASFKDDLDKPVRERQTILGFAAARDDGCDMDCMVMLTGRGCLKM